MPNNIDGHFRRKKITPKVSDLAENLQLYRVVRFSHRRSSCTMMHISADVHRITLNASCMMISGGRTKQLDIFRHVTGFMSDFLSFIVLEHIPFFHTALQMFVLCLSVSSLTSPSGTKYMGDQDPCSPRNGQPFLWIQGMVWYTRV